MSRNRRECAAISRRAASGVLAVRTMRKLVKDKPDIHSADAYPPRMISANAPMILIALSPNKHSATRMLCERRLHNNIRVRVVRPECAVSSGRLIAQVYRDIAMPTGSVQSREECVVATNNPTALKRWGRVVPFGAAQPQHPGRRCNWVGGIAYGSRTASMTWITPFDAMMSAVVTVAFSTVTPLRPSMWTSLPLTVATLRR